MATRQKEGFTEATRWRRRPRPTFLAGPGGVRVLLLILLTAHMVAQHLVVEGGLRTYDQVIAWIRNPVVFALEALLLICVTWHGIAGTRRRRRGATIPSKQTGDPTARRVWREVAPGEWRWLHLPTRPCRCRAKPSARWDAIANARDR
jgi:hypothetical protein